MKVVVVVVCGVKVVVGVDVGGVEVVVVCVIVCGVEVVVLLMLV